MKNELQELRKLFRVRCLHLVGLEVYVLTSLPFDKLGFDDFFPNRTVLIHLAGDLPIAGRPSPHNPEARFLQCSI